MREIVLASTSRYRRMLMDRLGIPYEAAAPACDEEGLDHLPVPERALALAVRKARSVAPLHPEALVIGSDQIAEVEGESLRKPGSFEAARESLRRLRGREHRLVTGVAIFDAREGRVEGALDTAVLRMRDLGDEEIDSYLRREEPYDCVGAYRIEGLGAALFESVGTEDPTGIVGLPLMKVTRLLARFGVEVLR